MNVLLVIKACFLGVVQGITEFVPISSSAHVILLSHLIGGLGPHTKDILIFLQGVSIMAVVSLYRNLLRGLFVDSSGRVLLASLACGVLPFGVIAFFIHRIVLHYFFFPPLISGFLILGGGIFFCMGKFFRHSPRIHSLGDVSPKMGFWVGLCQLFALFPGVSRSGATIIGGLLLGMSRPLSVSFSFLLAIPLLLLVSLFQAVKTFSGLTMDEWGLVLCSSLVTFLTAQLVVRRLVGFLSYGHNSFIFIGLYRIVLGLVILLTWFLPQLFF